MRLRPPSRAGQRWSVRLYRGLARALLPSDYRPLRDDLVATFGRRDQDHRARGNLAHGRFLAREIGSLLLQSVRERTGDPSAGLFRRWQRSLVLARDSAFLDLRQALSSWRRSRGLLAATVLTLAPAFAALSLVGGVLETLLAPLPVREPGKLVTPMPLRDGDPFMASMRDVAAWQKAKSFVAVGAARPHGANLRLASETRRIATAEITSGYLETLGVEPMVGRDLIPEDAGTGAVLVSHRLWHEALGGRSLAESPVLRLDGGSVRAVGVLPPRFALPFGADLWRLLPLRPDDPDGASRGLVAVGRLAPGIQRSEALAELRVLAGRLGAAYPDSHRDWSVGVIPLREQMLGDVHGRLRPTVAVLLLTAVLVYGLAVANCLFLLEVRIRGRREELAVRRALGAGRTRALFQLAASALVPLGLSMVSGLAVAVAGASAILRWELLEPLRHAPVHGPAAVGRLIVLTLGFAALVAVAQTLLAARRLPAGTPSRAARDRGSAEPGRRPGRLLVAAEVALAVLLLTLGGWLARTLHHLGTLELGFDPAGVVVGRIALSAHAGQGAEPAGERRARFLAALSAELETLPELDAFGITTNAPLDLLSSDARVWPKSPQVPLSEDDLLLVADRLVTPGALATLGLRLVEGRLLDTGDRSGAEPVAVVTADLAERLWPDRSAVGELVRRGGPSSESPWMRIVGVVAPVKEDRSAFRRDRAAWYLPLEQHPEIQRPLVLIASSALGPAVVAPELRRAVAAVSAETPLYEIRALQEQVDDLVATERLAVAVVGAFGLVGILLQAFGVFSVVLFTVARRRRETGIRLALGATGWRLVRRALGDTIGPAAVGLLAGLLGALATQRLLTPLLSEGAPGLGVPVLVAGATLLIAAAATLLPTLHAHRGNPMRSLMR